MELDFALNFTEICRCCKRTKFVMTSIFGGEAHSTDHTYPPVYEMLRSIASLNVHENDGLPSLVCTSCVDNIQDAYTFILHLNLVDEELWQIYLARANENYSLSQATNDLNQCISTEESVENEIEINSGDFVNDSLKVEDLDEPILNFDQLEYIDKTEVDALPDVPEIEETTEIMITTEVIQLNDVNDQEYKEDIIDPTPNTRKGRKGVDYIYIIENNSLRESANLNQTLETLDEDENIDETDESEENSEISPKLQATAGQITTLNLADRSVFKCNLCTYSSMHWRMIQQHLHKHCKDKPFACSKCNLRFMREGNMQRHKQKCNGEDKFMCDICNRATATKRILEIHKRRSHNAHNGEIAKQLIPLTLQDLRNPLRMKKYYTMTGLTGNENDMWNNHVDVNNRGGKHTELYKCKLCAFTSVYKMCLKQHLPTHLKNSNRPFACSKCKNRFTFRSSMQRHWRSCRGNDHRNAPLPHRGEASFTPQDLQDPLIMQKYYTVNEINTQVNHGELKVEKIQADADAANEKNRPESGKVLQKMSTLELFKCKLCEYTSARINNLKTHLLIHCKDNPFACSNCNRTFGQSTNMLRHRQKCYGESHMCAIPKLSHRSAKQVMLLTQQDLWDPVRVMQYYTLTIDEDRVEVDDGAIAQSQKYKCKLCEYTSKSARMKVLRSHLQVHCKDRPFVCAKCSCTFAQNCRLQRHLRTCKEETPLTQQDLRDPLKVMQYYTFSGDHIQDEHVQRPEDTGDEGAIEEIQPTSRRYKCKLCKYTTDASATKRRLKTHLQVHCKDKPFACSKCSYTFALNSRLQQHLRTCSKVEEETSNQVTPQETPLTLHDIEDPLKVKMYYTSKYYNVTKINQ